MVLFNIYPETACDKFTGLCPEFACTMRTDGKATFEILVWDPDHAEGLDIIGFQSEDFLKLKFTIYFNVSDVLLEKS